MSGLDKFEASESWRLNLKRKPTPKKTVVLEGAQRCSLDIAEDLQKLIKERRGQIEFEKVNASKSSSSITSQSSVDTMSDSEANCDDTCFGAASQELPLFDKVSDESFEALEKMCDKTASDPNSTLFQYLYSDNKDQVLSDVKKRSTGEEENVMVDQKEKDIRKHLVEKLSDCTLLDDIDAPSHIWEYTVLGEPDILKTSPVKMVGLMRPSTIMEEVGNESANSDISSQTSFKTANRGAASDISTSTYDTAFESESTVTTNRTDASKKEEEINVDDIINLAIKRTRELTERSVLSSSQTILSESFFKTQTESATENTLAKNETLDDADLIDLETTFVPVNNLLKSYVFNGNDDDNAVLIDDEKYVEEAEQEDEEDSEESVIDILSDEDEEPESLYPNLAGRAENNEFKSKNDTFEFETDLLDANKENVTQESFSSDRSMKFNDTIEEVEYMLKKGMEYMAAQGLHVVESVEKRLELPKPTPILQQKQPKVDEVKLIFPSKPLPKTTTNLKTCNTQPNSPKSILEIKHHGMSSATKGRESHFKTPAKTPIAMRPFPKFDIFGDRSPRNLTHPRQKELAGKQQFSHIISPVGAYMKNTALTPLMSTSKMKNTNASVMNSAAFRELEKESRLYESKFEIGSASSQCPSGLSPLPGVIGVPKSLPKKAYISSELKHIVDERTPITIPGGKKIQKYLENAMMPAVLRHDGKMKFPGAPNLPSSTKTSALLTGADSNMSSSVTSLEKNSIVPPLRRDNASLADLSVMSGDVSMYTIMDAQKF